jgi:hypothetical protein
MDRIFCMGCDLACWRVLSRGPAEGFVGKPNNSRGQDLGCKGTYPHSACILIAPRILYCTGRSQLGVTRRLLQKIFAVKQSSTEFGGRAWERSGRVWRRDGRRQCIMAVPRRRLGPQSLGKAASWLLTSTTLSRPPGLRARGRDIGTGCLGRQPLRKLDSSRISYS